MDVAGDQSLPYVRPLGKLVLYYFILVATLTIMVLGCPLVGVAFLFTIVLSPFALLMVIAPTLLVYSFALLPLYFGATARKRHLLFIAAAIPVPLVVAILPGIISQHQAWQYYKMHSVGDVFRSSPTKPKTIELKSDQFAGMYIGGGLPAAVCNDECFELLYYDEVDWVRMTETLNGKFYSATYRHVHLDVCPPLFTHGAWFFRAVNARMLSGDCVIEADDVGMPDVSVAITARYWGPTIPPVPASQPTDEPLAAKIVSTKDIIATIEHDGSSTQFLKKTQVTVRTLFSPFYVNLVGQLDHVRMDFFSKEQVINRIDLAQSLRDVFGYKVVRM